MSERSRRILQAVDEVMGPESRVAAERRARAHRDDAPPDPYEAVEQSRQLTQGDLTPDLDRDYEPFGTPPNSYALAMALRRVKSEAAK